MTNKFRSVEISSVAKLDVSYLSSTTCLLLITHKTADLE